MTFDDVIEVLRIYAGGGVAFAVLIAAGFAVDSACRLFRDWHDKGELP